ncbi:patatin-like phospholipase family protein [Sphingomonas radiodurans]|uniref:patatin-like phospholipase family protein n=1 Tax=Sphingomonas radiodurans TaxID=2890321 RepID=UPI001E33DEF9|nr:patatin-like phospholipase family protein [Sphingomonas radiodurans]WBH16810.1 patatin-like phospholipase family protein [Sphingomonas radiodurans]
MSTPVLPLAERIARPGPKKMLAVDGGGIRGVLALEVLAKIEADLRAYYGDPDYRLSSFFDAIAGTSTGAIIAAGLSLGMSVSELLAFYIESGEAMFKRAKLFRRLRHRFEDEPLADQLKAVFGERELGSADLQTVLMMVLRNASTDSPWPVSNNPYALFNAAEADGCNLELPLWQLVRASTAAPTYFPPEVIDVGSNRFVFVDGGVTMYNNPAFQLFLMMTVDRFWANAPAGLKRGWATGTDQMLLVSVGTGTSPGAHENLEPDDMNLLFNASTVPSALMLSALTEQDALCRIFGDCRAGDPLDMEIGDLIGSQGPLDRKLFRYVRYNTELTTAGLEAIGCTVDPARVQPMDAVSAIPEMRAVGQAVAASKVRPEYLGLEIFG